jgi:sortase (surface protein transpeptidase)
MKKWIYSLLLLCIAISCSGCKDAPTSPITNTERIQTRSDSALHAKTVPTEAPRVLETKPSPPVNPFMPNQITIPAIGLTAEIQPVTTLANGQMGVPETTDLVGLSYPGTLPGAKGNVLLAGHVDSYTGPAVFFQPKKAQTR